MFLLLVLKLDQKEEEEEEERKSPNCVLFVVWLRNIIQSLSICTRMNKAKVLPAFFLLYLAFRLHLALVINYAN